MQRKIVRFGHAVGLVVVILSILFVAHRFIEARVWELAAAKGPSLMAAVVIAAIAYGMSGFLLAASWVRIVRWCGQTDAPLRAGLALYGRTQIAKYLPGNVFHFVGRHVAGRQHGFDHLPMVWAAMLEAVGMVLVAAAIALVGTLLWLPVEAGLSSMALAAAAVLAASAPFVLSRGAVWIAQIVGVPAQRRSAMDLVRGLLPAYLLYALFFVLSATIVWGLATVLGGARPSAMPILAASLSAAWIAGYLTPGAAAGLGVREAVLTATLSDLLGPSNAALLAIGYRGATLLGDVVFFAVSVALTAPARRLES